MKAMAEYILEQKPEDQSLGRYAVDLGLTPQSLAFYRTGERKTMRLDSFGVICQYFNDKGRPDVVSNLVSRAIGIEGEFTQSP